MYNPILYSVVSKRDFFVVVFVCFFVFVLIKLPGLYIKIKLKRFKKNGIYYDKKQHANFMDRPLFQATEEHLDNNVCEFSG